MQFQKNHRVMWDDQILVRDILLNLKLVCVAELDLVVCLVKHAIVKVCGTRSIFNLITFFGISNNSDSLFMYLI